MKQRSNGFTLLEVLVALAILAIALTAILRAANENARYVDYIRDKTTAHWVAQNIINRIQAGHIETKKNTKQQGKTVAFNKTWHWTATISNTDKTQIKEILVSVTPSSQGKTTTRLLAYTWEDSDE